MARCWNHRSLLRESPGTDRAGAVRRAYRIVLAREPRRDEVDQAVAFLASQSDRLRRLARAGQPLARPLEPPPATDPADAAALVDFCVAMLNRNEFVYVP